MFTRLSLRPSDAEAQIGAEIQMVEKGRVGRIAFALVTAVVALRWLPLGAASAYFAVAFLWEWRGVPWVARRLSQALRTDRNRLRLIYRSLIFLGACFYSIVPLSGLISHQLIGWYTALIAFCWATIVGVTYFSNDRWLFAACSAPSFVIATAAPLVFGVPASIVALVLLLHALFVLGALQSAAHRAELVEGIAKGEEARSRAVSANLEKSRFIANVSNELRTPLNDIIGYSELLRESAADAARPQDQADLDKVLEASRTLMMLVQELLDISKLEAGRLNLDVSGFDVGEVIAAAVAKARPIASARGNVFALDIASDLGQGVGDEYRTGQCVFNLLSNAARAAEGGTITVRARRRDENNRQALVVAVTDCGGGMSADIIAQLFDPFAQDELTPLAHGSRLGLAITRRIARLLGGDLTVTSQPGAGSTFTLQIPADARETKGVEGVLGANDFTLPMLRAVAASR